MIYVVSVLLVWDLILSVMLAIAIRYGEDTRKLIKAMIKGREKFYASLTDVDSIMADMERGSVAMEALAAKRRRNVREDAGPHARIFKPKRVGRLPKAK